MSDAHTRLLIQALELLGVPARMDDDRVGVALTAGNGQAIGLRLNHADGALEMLCPLSALPVTATGLGAALLANYELAGADGACFALSPAADCLVLLRHQPLDRIDAAQLADAIRALAALAAHWSARLSAAESPLSTMPDGELQSLMRSGLRV